MSTTTKSFLGKIPPAGPDTKSLARFAAGQSSAAELLCTSPEKQSSPDFSRLNPSKETFSFASAQALNHSSLTTSVDASKDWLTCVQVRFRQARKKRAKSALTAPCHCSIVPFQWHRTHLLRQLIVTKFARCDDDVWSFCPMTKPLRVGIPFLKTRVHRRMGTLSQPHSACVDPSLIPRYITQLDGRKHRWADTCQAGIHSRSEPGDNLIEDFCPRISNAAAANNPNPQTWIGNLALHGIMAHGVGKAMCEQQNKNAMGVCLQGVPARTLKSVSLCFSARPPFLLTRL